MAFGARRGGLTGNATSITNPFAISTGGPISVFVGDLIIAVLGEQTNRTVSACTDNASNTYTALTGGTDAGTSTCRAFFFRATNNFSLTSVSFTATASSDNVAAVATVIEGPFTASPLDITGAEITTDITSPFTCSTTGTLSQAQEAVIAWAVATGSTVWSATSPNLLGDQVATASVLHTLTGYQAVTVTTSIAPEFTAGANPTDAVLGRASFRRDISQPKQESYWPTADADPPKALDWIQVLPTPLQPVESEFMPSAITDSDNPAIPARAERTTINQAIREEPVVAAPFNQTDWPKPLASQIANRTGINTSTQMLLADPFVQSDWPKPVPVLRTVDWAGINISTQMLLADPFVQSDWPTLRALRKVDGWINQAIREIVTPPEKPFAQTDWDNPKVLRQAIDHTWINLAINTEFVPREVLIAPMRRSKPKVVDGWTQSWAHILPEPPAGPQPFMQADWPNPARGRPLNDWWEMVSLAEDTPTPPSPSGEGEGDRPVWRFSFNR